MESLSKSKVAGVNIQWQIARLMARIVPDDTELSDEALELMEKLLRQQLRMVTQAAVENCIKDRRMRLQGSDVVHSMLSLGHTGEAALLEVFYSKILTFKKLQRNKFNYDGLVRVRGVPSDSVSVQEDRLRMTNTAIGGSTSSSSSSEGAAPRSASVTSAEPMLKRVKTEK
jgi:histone H3/H4